MYFSYLPITFPKREAVFQKRAFVNPNHVKAAFQPPPACSRVSLKLKLHLSLNRRVKFAGRRQHNCGNNKRLPRTISTQWQQKQPVITKSWFLTSFSDSCCLQSTAFARSPFPTWHDIIPEHTRKKTYSEQNIYIYVLFGISFKICAYYFLLKIFYWNCKSETFLE